MPRGKEPPIPDAILDHLLAGADAKTAFDANGLLDDLKKALARRSFACGDKLITAAGAVVGVMPSPNWRNYRPSMPPGWKRCRTVYKTAPPPMLCGQSAIST